MRGNNDLPRIIITTGEPAGIGPDITVQIAQKNINADIVAIGDPDLLQDRASLLGLPLSLTTFDDAYKQKHVAKTLRIIPVKTETHTIAGKLDVHNAEYVLTLLKTACTACLNNEFDAMVTAPVQKSIINDAAIAFSGHTEFLADLCQQATPVMMLENKLLRVALVTTHLPLSKVSDAITKDKLTEVLQIVDKDLRDKFSINKPRILVCGLNPHAGENGHLGNEENEIIIPVINTLRDQGLDLTGPQPADTAFTQEMIDSFDVVVAMYHDQGLPVLKSLGFGETVNITLGLPIVRTSVDHGTALHLAGTGNASCSSLMEAIQSAIDLSSNTSDHSASADPPAQILNG
ncbi:MAG: 4-hydroxythreonine-4-phosphate dehydrogenase PdxA [Gammaproteobacteria bacterium]|nr:MAG: 4-hydroxythreonine-4-phosphate dehydrogenase PdxA [Gammaproteobacteria bacterium]RKZ71841.1 MAG: 4-hydroxythreonine-4-phosphate dehydrogenase PdxA [Gammaproteobacteria bacterium]